MLNTFYDKFIFTNSIHYTNNNFFLTSLPFVMMPASLLQAIERVPFSHFQRELYASVKDNTQNQLLHRFEQEFGLKRKKIMAFFQAFITASGWGLVEIEDIDAAEFRALISVKNTPTKTFFLSPAQRPVDTLLRGIFAGLFCVEFKEPVDCVETACCAMGENACHFVIKKKEEFDFSNALVQEQLDPD